MKKGGKLGTITITPEQEDPVDDKGFVRERGPALGLTPIVPRFCNDLEALLLLTAGETPIKRVVRRKEIVTAVYGFGDASSGGFGASVYLKASTGDLAFGVGIMKTSHPTSGSFVT